MRSGAKRMPMMPVTRHISPQVTAHERRRVTLKRIQYSSTVLIALHTHRLSTRITACDSTVLQRLHYISQTCAELTVAVDARCWWRERVATRRVGCAWAACVQTSTQPRDQHAVTDSLYQRNNHVIVSLIVEYLQRAVSGASLKSSAQLTVNTQNSLQ